MERYRNPCQKAFEMSWEAYKTGTNMAHAEMTPMLRQIYGEVVENIYLLA